MSIRPFPPGISTSYLLHLVQKRIIDCLDEEEVVKSQNGKWLYCDLDYKADYLNSLPGNLLICEDIHISLNSWELEYLFFLQSKSFG